MPKREPTNDCSNTCRRSRGRVVHGIIRVGTPIEFREEWGLWVKREDLACLPPGPYFSKIRGCYRRIASRPEAVIGVLDTYHSQAGAAVARVCRSLGKRCLNYYPEYKREPGPRAPQRLAQSYGAELVGLPAGRSAILYHQAKKLCQAEGGYMMPNALKLPETVAETAAEVPNRPFRYVLIPASSGTIAAGVIRGFVERGIQVARFLIHLGYSRPETAVLKYLLKMSGVDDFPVEVIDEGYQYRDTARPGPTPDWPCNPYYDLKAFRWWVRERERYPDTLFWNIG